ncbi:MAG: glycosyltransferase, partial [Chloroflexota bacterium]|nr:glycosyltransferase [Chloroflexota bacterium]
LELIVVDNASSDGSANLVADLHPAARVVRNPVNEGFGAANNRAFELASGSVWLLLNPDAVLEADALGHLLSFLASHPRAGAAAPAIASPGHGAAESCGMAPGLRSAIGHFLFVNRLLPDDRGGAWRGFQLHRRKDLRPRRVDWASAAALALRPAAVRAVGGFDPSFFLYGEDVDLGERLGRAGWDVWLVPSARAHHLIAASQGGISTRWLDGIHAVYARRANRAGTVAFALVIALGLSLRAAMASLPRAGASRLHADRMRAASFRALRLARRSLATGA